MKNLKNKLFIIFSLLCALALTSCMDLYDGHEVQTSFTVTFHGNGGIYPGTSEVTSYTQTFAYGEEKDLTKNQFIRSGYVFLGWAESEKSTTVNYVDGSKFKTFSDRNLYAVWGSGEFTVTFDANGGTGNMEPQIFKVGVTKKLSKNTFIYEGKGFAGWAKSKDATTADYPDENTMSVTQNMTLYAVWKDIYYITFESNGGSGSMEKQAFVDGVEQAISINKFTKAGYIFTGWSKTENVSVGSGHDYTDGQSITLNSTTGNMTLYAVWFTGSTNLYVSETGNDDNDGSAVDDAHAFRTLAKAIDRINVVGATSETWNVFIKGTVTGSPTGNTNISTFDATKLIIQKADSDPCALDGNNNGCVIEVSTDANIEINDVTIKNGSASGIHIVSTGAQVTLNNTVTVTQNSGNYGAGIYVELGKLTLEGAIITANNGSGLYVAGGTNGTGEVIMNSGTISNNTGAVNGGGVYVANGKFTMNGGSIVNHTVTGNGGGVYIQSGVFELTNGNIGSETAQNKAANGGGIYNESGTVTMSGGLISWNTANDTNSFGGGIYNSGKFSMSNGQITKNIAEKGEARGGGIYNAVGAELTLSGNALIGDESYLSPTKFNCSNYSKSYGAGVYNKGTITLSGNYKITGNYTSATGGGIYTNGTLDDSKTTNIINNKAHLEEGDDETLHNYVENGIS